MKINLINDNWQISEPLLEEFPIIEITDEQYEQLCDGLLEFKNGKLVNSSRKQTIENEQELETMLNNLSATDYIANKLIEAETEQEREQIRQQYAETLAQRQIWRNRASELKDMLKQK